MKLLQPIKSWWLTTIHDVGKKVYWDNRNDPEFTGEYILTSKRDKNGYVEIYNEKVGNRVVPHYYVTTKLSGGVIET